MEDWRSRTAVLDELKTAYQRTGLEMAQETGTHSLEGSDTKARLEDIYIDWQHRENERLKHALQLALKRVDILKLQLGRSNESRTSIENGAANAGQHLVSTTDAPTLMIEDSYADSTSLSSDPVEPADPAEPADPMEVADPVETEDPVTADTVTKQQYIQLVEKYNRIHQEREDLLDSNKQLQEKAEKAKSYGAELKTWAKHCKGLEKKISRLETQLASNEMRENLPEEVEKSIAPHLPASLCGSFSTEKSASPAPPNGPLAGPSARITTGLTRHMSLSRESSPTILPARRSAPPRSNLVNSVMTPTATGSLARRAENNARLLSSDGAEQQAMLEGSPSETNISTQYDSPDPVKTQPNLPQPKFITRADSDEVVVVSSRSVRKRRKISEAPNEEHAITPKVKVETIDSSPVGLAGVYDLQESMDLDDIGMKVKTPKRRRPLKIPRDAPDDGVHTPEARPERQKSVLQTLSTNKRILPRTSGDLPSSKRRRLDDQGLKDLVDDGDSIIGSKQKKPSPLTAEKKSEASKRLSSLLDPPSPRKVETIRKPASRLSRNISPEQPAPRETPLASRASRGLGNQNTPASAGTRLPINKGKEPAMPLRTRPIHELNIEDFRVNPAYNEGYTYAWADTVRGKDKRKCMTGCTDPKCCGKQWRRLAEIERPDGDFITRSQEERDDKLLKEFLGDDIKRLDGMSKNERKEMLIEARTRQLANQHGRHRHMYERRQSPPGFWRADFPTTQEAEEDRKQAQKLEREKVERRYREAMRPVGQYKFRDEM